MNKDIFSFKTFPFEDFFSKMELSLNQILKLKIMVFFIRGQIETSFFDMISSFFDEFVFINNDLNNLNFSTSYFESIEQVESNLKDMDVKKNP